MEARRSVRIDTILVPVDNSPYSAWAAEIALQLGRAFHATITGTHVYAARLHERRFRDMEPGLPEAYREPATLAHQREVHATLIEKGLRLIADSYLDALEARSVEAGIGFVGKTPEGKNYTEIVRDVETSRYDLVVMGARGMGETWRPGEHHDQALGSVCERVVRRVTRDVLAVKNERPLEGTFVVGVDGSPRSFAALRVALALASVSGATVHAVAAWDPFLHKALFQKLGDVLSDEARRVFNSAAQRKLHDELIDRGIAGLYEGYLDTARRLATETGASIECRLLAGKPGAAILRYLAEVEPSLLVVGRTGLHADAGLDVGATAENLLRLAPCHVLLVGRTFTPTSRETRAVVEEPLAWTPDALARIERVPAFVRAMVQKAIEAHARAQGLAAVDERLVQDARQRFGG